MRSWVATSNTTSVHVCARPLVSPRKRADHSVLYYRFDQYNDCRWPCNENRAVKCYHKHTSLLSFIRIVLFYHWTPWAGARDTLANHTRTVLSVTAQFGRANKLRIRARGWKGRGLCLYGNGQTKGCRPLQMGHYVLLPSCFCFVGDKKELTIIQVGS